MCLLIKDQLIFMTYTNKHLNLYNIEQLNTFYFKVSLKKKLFAQLLLQIVHNFLKK